MQDKFDFRRISHTAFDCIDDYVDSFALISDVRTNLMFGSPNSNEPLLFSIIIPTFNREQLFYEAIKSALSQENVIGHWEVIVVDNTPLDENGLTPALRIIEELNSERVRYYHNAENIGSGYNWNRGAELAHGKWLVFLHDDDILLPHGLKDVEQQITSYCGKKTLGYIHARRQDFTDGDTLDFSAEKHRYPMENLSRFGMVISGCTGAGAPTCGTAILRKAYLETGGINYDYGPSADAVLCYQIMNNYAVVSSRFILGGYRWGKNETLKKESLLTMITADELLSQYTYRQDGFSKFWGSLFGGASSWRNIYRKKKIADKYNLDVSEEELGQASVYMKPNCVKRGAFLSVYAFYRFCRLIKGWVNG